MHCMMLAINVTDSCGLRNEAHHEFLSRRRNLGNFVSTYLSDKRQNENLCNSICEVKWLGDITYINFVEIGSLISKL